jgi:Family of unknown function (DUF695)
MSATAAATEPNKGFFARTFEDGRPVVYKALMDKLPAAAAREKLPWLTIIEWRYDGSESNGMPPETDDSRMSALEDAISSQLEREGFLRHAYSRTGNGLKELVYYINDRDGFIEAFNAALAGHERYPIEIIFHEDPAWDYLQELIEAASSGG